MVCTCRGGATNRHKDHNGAVAQGGQSALVSSRGPGGGCGFKSRQRHHGRIVRPPSFAHTRVALRLWLERSVRKTDNAETPTENVGVFPTTRSDFRGRRLLNAF